MSDPDHNAPEMLTQPLLTEEGFLNPACMNELESAIANMGKPHERLSLINDPEWSESKDRWTTPKDIVGAFAMWACRQSPYGVPDGLESVCKYLYAALQRVTTWETAGMRQCSLCEISGWLYEILHEQGITEFDAWNRAKVGDTSEIQFTSRYDSHDPDYDFIDLDALLRNVCVCIRDERRANKAFNDKFDLEQSQAVQINVQTNPPEARLGWRLFYCEACGHRWQWPSRDMKSQSAEHCPQCNEECHPHEYEADASIPCDDMGNLTVPHDWDGRTEP